MRRAVLVGCVIAVAGALGIALAQVERSCPAVLDLDDCSVTIEQVQFKTVVELEGGRMEEKDPDEYRFAVVTLAIHKPAGRALTLPAADLTLHYRRAGDEFDVAPCEALSNFTVSRSEDRELNAPNFNGPGWIKSKTGTASREATTIYADAAFAKVESDVSRMWICVGQPGTPSYQSNGW